MGRRQVRLECQSCEGGCRRGLRGRTMPSYATQQLEGQRGSPTSAERNHPNAIGRLRPRCSRRFAMRSVRNCYVVKRDCKEVGGGRAHAH